MKRALYRFSVKFDLASYLGQWGDLLPIHSQLDILGALLVVKGVLLLLRVLRTDSTSATDYVMGYPHDDSFGRRIKIMVMLSGLVLLLYYLS